jgi:hypothetical protein
MAVSKRTRFEVLRRDNYTCRYCRSADNPLRVDHVTPVALGGTDDPTNLVAACQDCNAGKSSTSLSGEHVADIKADAIRWASAMQRAAEEEAANLPTTPDDLQWFRSKWYDLTFTSPPFDWQRSIETFMAHGMTRDLIERTLAGAARRLKEIGPDDRFRYFCGCCWGKVRDLRARAEAIVSEETSPDA